jgi:hypothetical protein
MRWRRLAAVLISILLAVGAALTLAYLRDTGGSSCDSLPTRHQGLYQHELTEDDVLRQYGFDPEYIGTWQLRLDRCAYAVFNKGIKVDEGSYNVTERGARAGKLELRGGPCPDRSPGRYEYQLRANALILRRSGPDECPGRTARLVVEPWTRVSEGE